MQSLKKISLGLTISSALALMATSAGASTNSEIDNRLIEQLSFDSETLERVQGQMGERPSPSEIRALRYQLSLEEAARQNPTAPTITNQVLTVDRGQSPTLDIMQRFDTTIVFADRAGNPLNLKHWRISDESSAELIPLRDNERISAAVPPANPQSQQPPETDDFAIYTGPNNQGQQDQENASGSEEGVVNALIISPREAMRSTNITVRVEGEDYPIVLTVRSHPSTEVERELAYVNEIRLDWVVKMHPSMMMAGKYQQGEALKSNMLSLLQGIPGPELRSVELNGSLSSQISLWRDATDRDNPTYFLRMADHLSPWNIAIADQSHDRMRGFTVIELNGAPPKAMGFTSNGQYSSVTIAN